MKWENVQLEDKPKSMAGHHIYCYHCRRTVAAKSELKVRHRGHEVGWVEDGK